MKLWLMATIGIREAWLRSSLTLLSVMFAFLLFAITNSVLSGFDDLLLAFKDTRLRVVNRANFSQTLPTAHANRIKQIEGVANVSGGLAFPAYFQDPSQSFGGAAVDLSEYLKVLPEILLSEDEIQAVEQNRIGASVGIRLAERFGWKPGDRVPVTSTYLVNENGNKRYEVEVMAIHHVKDGENTMFAGEMYINYDYASEYSVSEKNKVHMFVVTLAEPGFNHAVAEKIDLEFSNSAYETSTFNEREFLLNRMRQVGDIQTFVNYIMTAVFFTLLFIVGNTIARSVRKRQRNIGILRAVGFTHLEITAGIVGESMIITAGGAVLGLLIAAVVLPAMFPDAPISLVVAPGVWLSGLSIAFVFAVVVSIWPVYRSANLTVAEVLAKK